MAAQDYSSIEKLLGLEEGSTNNALASAVDSAQTTSLVKTIDDKTKQITQAFDKVTTIQSLPKTEIMKTGLSLEKLEEDRESIINEARMIYDISKKMLEKLYDDIKDKIVVTDRMYDAASKLIASVIASNKALRDINTQYRNEEDLRRMSEATQEVVGEEDGKKKRLSPADITLLIAENRKRRGIEDAKVVAQDAEIVPPKQAESEV